MHSPSLPAATPARRRTRAKIDKRVNLTIDSWFKQRTELPKKITGWTPLTILYSDYREFCGLTGVAADQIQDEQAFGADLAKRCDREPRELLCQVGAVKRYEMCWPRYLIPARQLGAFN
ncbi:hypothetical protein [Sphingomonas sp. SRS2]|uniref:hypothetical protein n=1 Tax=Sphingomonas sp. SRS2 TaxID=133190 RepID=UPI000618450A|nr:hypothetical protein [Sphingomonas sp. SRS2]KKC24904.1 hypothetical protein WP12_16910 [Sphingomonas sp. SRS2]